MGHRKPSVDDLELSPSPSPHGQLDVESSCRGHPLQLDIAGGSQLLPAPR